MVFSRISLILGVRLGAYLPFRREKQMLNQNKRTGGGRESEREKRGRGVSKTLVGPFSALGNTDGAAGATEMKWALEAQPLLAHHPKRKSEPQNGVITNMLD